jgi:hypothetical protein
MATTIDASAVFSGAPVSLTFNSVECGATIGVPKFEIEVESGAPQFTNAGGPVINTRINRRAIPSVTLQVNEFTAEKLGWAMPGSSGNPLTWTLGRVASSEYHDLILTSQPNADGEVLTLTLYNCLSAETQSMDFDDDPANPLGLTLKFTAHYAEATPLLVPFSLEIA